MFNTDNKQLNELYYFITKIKDRLSYDEINEVTDIYNEMVLSDENYDDKFEQLELLESMESELTEHIQDTINEVVNIFSHSENDSDKLLVEIFEVIARNVETSNELSTIIDRKELITLIDNMKNVELSSDIDIDYHEDFKEVDSDDLYSNIKYPAVPELVHTRLGENDLLKEGSLIQDKKGNLFTVDKVVRYRYKGETCKRIEYYPISDTGLITKTKLYKCKLNDFNSKFKLIDNAIKT